VIYAIQAVGTDFIKFGKANSVSKRLKDLEVGNPHELHIVGAADWPDGAETAIHKYLATQCERGEWFRDGELVQQVIGWMLNDSFEHLQVGIADAVEKQTIRKLARQNRKRKRTAKAVSLAGARDQHWSKSFKPLTRKEQRQAWWDSPSGVKAAQQIDNELEST
jgi:hypothetical protein